MAPKPGRRDDALTPETKALIEKYHDLAMRIAWDYIRQVPARAGVNANDILSVAAWALVDAALRWRPYCEENGYDPVSTNPGEDFFNVFCQKNVRGAIQDYRRQCDYVPREVRELYRDITTITDSGRTFDEAVAILGITRDKARSVVAAVHQPPFIVTDLQEDDAIGDTETAHGASYLLWVFSTIIELMPYKNRAVLSLRYYAGMQLPEIAQALNMPDSAVQKLHTDSIMQIKDQMERAASGA